MEYNSTKNNFSQTPENEPFVRRFLLLNIIPASKMLGHVNFMLKLACRHEEKFYFTKN